MLDLGPDFSCGYLTVPHAAHDVMIRSPDYGVAVMHNFLNQPEGVDDSCVAALASAPFTLG